MRVCEREMSVCVSVCVCVCAAKCACCERCASTFIVGLNLTEYILHRSLFFLFVSLSTCFCYPGFCWLLFLRRFLFSRSWVSFCSRMRGVRIFLFADEGVRSLLCEFVCLCNTTIHSHHRTSHSWAQCHRRHATVVCPNTSSSDDGKLFIL